MTMAIHRGRTLTDLALITTRCFVGSRGFDRPTPQALLGEVGQRFRPEMPTLEVFMENPRRPHAHCALKRVHTSAEVTLPP